MKIKDVEIVKVEQTKLLGVLRQDNIRNAQGFIYVLEMYSNEGDMFITLTDDEEISLKKIARIATTYERKGYLVSKKVSFYMNKREEDDNGGGIITVAKVNRRVALDNEFSIKQLKYFDKYVYMFKCFSEVEGIFSYALSYEDEVSQEELFRGMEQIKKDEDCLVDFEVQLYVKED